MVDINVNPGIAIFLLSVGIACLGAKYLFSIKFDDREPPVVNAAVPYVGHIFGFLRHGQSYLQILSAKNKLPIYTIQTLHKKVYVVTAPELIQAVDRASKTLTFHPFLVLFAPGLMGADKEAMEVMTRNVDLKDGPWGLCYEVTQGMHSVLAPGASLDRMIKTMLGQFLPLMDQLAGDPAKGTEIDFFKWACTAFAISSGEAVYGPGNPFAKDPSLVQDFWIFEEGVIGLLLHLPTPAARRAHRHRARLIQALKEYFDRGDHERGPDMVKMRYRVSTPHGSSNQSLACFEIGNLIGILTNATPTFFWTILYIYRDVDLLQSLREEVEATVSTTKTDGGKHIKHCINVTTLQERCPLLVSTFREVLRCRTRFSTARWVSEDTLLADRYLLTKDSAIQMPGSVVHADPTIWGAGAGEFNARRFLKHSENEEKPTDQAYKNQKGLAAATGATGATKADRLHPGALRTWGGGQTLCPGRFFATAEIISALAMWIARFDVTPAGGKWKMPRENEEQIASSVHAPKQDVKLLIRTRAALEGHEWQYVFGDEGDFD